MTSSDEDRLTLNQIFSGGFPFVIIMPVVVLLQVAAPELSLVLN